MTYLSQLSRRRILVAGAFLALFGAPLACAQDQGQAKDKPTVRDADGLRRAVAQAKPGSEILIAPGEYPGGFYFSNLKGTGDQRILIAAADPRNPPVFKGGKEGMHLSSVAYVELRDLHFQGFANNGLNIDDGGSYTQPSHHIVLRNLKVSEIGPRGNHDGIKLSGIEDFRIENCTIENWGIGGQGIDMVGCHRGVIEGCTIRHNQTADSAGIQAKGGTSNILVRRCRFENAGARPMQIGGSTGLQFFRPPLSSFPKGAPLSEAKDIIVEGNTFIGGAAAVTFVGVDGATFRYNTIYNPGRWAFRILQETRAPGFVPSRNGKFTDNIIVFDTKNWATGGVNISPGTAPETFTFARNVWYAMDNPAQSRPTLPAKEVDGVYGKDPGFRNPEKGDFGVKPDSPAAKAGAHALPAQTKAP